MKSVENMMLKIPEVSYLRPNGKLSTKCKTTIDDATLVEALRIMLRTRHVDERMITLQRQGVISFAMSSRGEECCAVASAAALKGVDWIFPQYREQGALFWRGFSIQDYVHHMFCNAKDIIRGRQMPNHFGSRALNVVTVSSPLGTQIPQAAGTAYAMKQQGKEEITLCYFGDGTTSEGDFHVGLNFAAVRKAPVIFFCRNNKYAISTRIESQFASDGIAPKGIGYGMKAVRVDGNDFFAIYEAVKNARKYCLQGNGPVLIEAMTFRVGAHSTSDDPSRYRGDSETQEWEAKCPVKRLRIYLEGKGLWNNELQEKTLNEVRDETSAAIDEAKQTGNPEIDSMIEDVYETTPALLKQQLSWSKEHSGH